MDESVFGKFSQKMKRSMVLFQTKASELSVIIYVTSYASTWSFRFVSLTYQYREKAKANQTNILIKSNILKNSKCTLNNCTVLVTLSLYLADDNYSNATISIC